MSPSPEHWREGPGSAPPPGARRQTARTGQTEKRPPRGGHGVLGRNRSQRMRPNRPHRDAPGGAGHRLHAWTRPRSRGGGRRRGASRARGQLNQPVRKSGERTDVKSVPGHRAHGRTGNRAACNEEGSACRRGAHTATVTGTGVGSAAPNRLPAASQETFEAHHAYEL